MWKLSSTVAVLAALLTWAAGPVSAGEWRAPDRGLSVASYNIHHGAGVDERLDLERIAAEIERGGADVVGLQEVDRHWSSRSDFVDQATWLAERLDMNVAYAANLDLEPLEPGQPRRRYGTAVLSRFPILCSRNTLLPRPRGGEQRGLLEAVLKVRGARVRFANTHLQHDSSEERLAQTQTIAELLGDAKEPTVLVGDLNAVPEAPELAPLWPHFEDTWSRGGAGPGYTYPAEAPDRRIDYVLVTPDVDVRSAEVLSSPASDHLQVTAELAVPRSRGWASHGRFCEGMELPLGRPGSAETRSAQALAAGVLHTRIVHGESSARDAWVVDVAFERTRAAALALVGRLEADGFDARSERIGERAQDDPERGPLGYLVRVGRLATEAEALALRDGLIAAGYAASRIVFTGEDGGPTSGPWVVNVLEIDFDRFAGTVTPALATDIVPGRELLSGLAARRGALASLNGGYFVIGAANGTDGDLAGSSLLDGVPVSEAVDGRTSLVLPEAPYRRPFVSAVSDRLTVTAEDGARRVLDGLNREPGLIRGCGGSGGDLPTERPKHDFTCTDDSELIRYTAIFGTDTPSGVGAETVLDRMGQVLELRATRGGPIPPGGSVLAGTGDAADWLRTHAQPGDRLDVAAALWGERGPLAADRLDGIVNGGPRLLRRGRVDILAAAEGFHWPENPEFFYRFGLRRNPRTLAGVTADGRLLLVAIDGRRPGHSVGASFDESARIMRGLAATDAVNLDGGGSTAMTAGSALVTLPSDATGERPIADALIVGQP